MSAPGERRVGPKDLGAEESPAWRFWAAQPAPPPSSRDLTAHGAHGAHNTNSRSLGQRHREEAAWDHSPLCVWGTVTFTELLSVGDIGCDFRRESEPHGTVSGE